MTGHGSFGKFLCRIGKKGDPSCDLCGEDVDNALHVLRECPVWDPQRIELKRKLGLTRDFILGDIIDAIISSDEANFEINGNVNRHNCRFWTNKNPHWMREAHTQNLEKLNVWAGIYNNTLIGPFFIDDLWVNPYLAFTGRVDSYLAFTGRVDFYLAFTDRVDLYLAFIGRCHVWVTFFFFYS
ncbi:transposable element tc3 transposase [Lasius niger]|uniref:Transposable element tc3 transposase n=1 Tax=Lasius niger TaxID=67767 RepID=A0A0J7K0Z4_LASNI|nr:transposable element tc3 transposase [Lasius niger]